MNREKTTALHSRYNPQGEAERYINSLSLNEKTRFFILIEPGLGYMVAPLRKKVPGAKVIVLHAEEPACPSIEAPDSQWYPETGISVQDFLEAEIPDSEASDVRLLEWRPALSVYGKTYLNLVEETTAFIKRTDANARTLSAFGPRWFKNFFRNLGLIREVICPTPENFLPFPVPFLVTGAGPGLENAISEIREEPLRQNIFILAAASSQTALKAQGIFPNLLIATDGSNWAKFHLFEFFRDTTAKEICPIAAAMTAALPSQCGTLPVLPIIDGSFWQALILKELEIPFIALPQRGTVTATALDLAFALTKEDIHIAGMDLANRDIRSHARPYSFDRFLEEKEQRINPVYSQSYKRSSSLKDGGSYGIYASWFKKQLSLYPRPVHAMGDNNPVFDSLKTVGSLVPGPASKMPTEPQNRQANVMQNFNTVSLDLGKNPARKAYFLLENAMKDPVHGEIVQKELRSLLLPGKKAAHMSDLPDAINALIGFSPKENDAHR